MIRARIKSRFKIIAVGLSFAFALSSVASELTSARIYPFGKVTIYNRNQRIGEFSREAPLPEGFFIAADGRCGVKIQSVYLVAEDQSLFSISTTKSIQRLSIKEGTIYFATSGNTPALSFATPSGDLAVLDIVLNAAVGTRQLKGYVSAGSEGSELGVIEGGSMIVSTHQGELMIKSGQRLILSQADMDIGAPPPPKEKPAEKETPKTESKQEAPEGQVKKAGKPLNKNIIIGAVAGGVLLAGLGALAAGGGGGSGSGGGSPISPSSPTP